MLIYSHKNYKECAKLQKNPYIYNIFGVFLSVELFFYIFFVEILRKIAVWYSFCLFNVERI